MITIRNAIVEDAVALINVMKSAEASGFMLFGPDERKLSTEGIAKIIDSFQNDSLSNLFIAELNQHIVGYLILRNEGPKRIAHRGYIVIGIHESNRGQGVGKALFTAAIQWAKQVKLHRLELTVMATNDAGFHLYQKMGFEVEGTKKDSLYVDGQYVDEYCLALIL